jgi:hypothetical protein
MPKKKLLTPEEKAERRRARAQRWRDKNKEKLRLYFAAYRKAKGLNAYAAAYYRKNKAKWRERSKRPDVKAKARAQRTRTKDQRNAKHLDWCQRNPDRAEQIARRHREKRKPQKREADRLYRLQKPEAYKASIARAKAAKPDLYNAIAVQSSLRRRARKRGLPVERVSWKRLRARAGGRCHLCGKTIAGRGTFDHLIPVLRGGAHAEWNLMHAHDRCNKSRGTKPLFTPETRKEAERYIASRLAQFARETA